MDDSHILIESLENLYYFEYYKFKRSFGIAFLVIGILYSLNQLLDLYYFYITGYSVLYISGFPYYHIGLISVILKWLMIFYMAYIVKTLKKSKIENGVLVKTKTTIGILIIIIGMVFSSPISYTLLSPFISNSIPSALALNFETLIEEYVSLMILLVIYYIEAKLFFPKERKKSLITVLIIFILLMIVSSIFYYNITLIVPNPNFNILFSIESSSYVLIVLTFNGILLTIFGLIEMRSLPRKKGRFTWIK